MDWPKARQVTFVLHTAKAENDRLAPSNPDFIDAARLPFAQKGEDRHPFVATTLQRGAMQSYVRAFRFAAACGVVAAIAWGFEQGCFRDAVQ